MTQVPACGFPITALTYTPQDFDNFLVLSEYHPRFWFRVGGYYRTSIGEGSFRVDIVFHLQDELVYDTITDSIDIITVDCNPRAEWFNVPTSVPALVETHVSLDISSQPAYCAPDYSTF